MFSHKSVFLKTSSSHALICLSKAKAFTHHIYVVSKNVYVDSLVCKDQKLSVLLLKTHCVDMNSVLLENKAKQNQPPKVLYIYRLGLNLRKSMKVGKDRIFGLKGIISISPLLAKNEIQKS